LIYITDRRNFGRKWEKEVEKYKFL